MKKYSTLMDSKRIRVLILLSLLALIALEASFGQMDPFLESRLLNLSTAQPPEVREGMLVLTHNGDPKIRTVGARFAHEDFARLHIFKRNPNDVFFLVYPIPDNVETARYRIMVDGLWMRDPLNALNEWDPMLGLWYSVVEVESRPESVPVNPTETEDSRLCFVYQGLAGQNVQLVGDFNAWNPYRHRLEPTEGHPTRYSICLRLGPGRHFYRFLVDGEPLADPLNMRRMIDRDGQEVSYFDHARQQ